MDTNLGDVVSPPMVRMALNRVAIGKHTGQETASPNSKGG